MKKLCTDAAGRRQGPFFRRGLLFIPLLAVALFTAGCGSSSSTSSTSTPVSSAADTVTGIFLDAPVRGLDYASGGASGVTDAKGSFQCAPQQQVTFSVDHITLGSTQCASVVTPLDLVPGADAGHPQVQAIASFLQSMDGDGNPANGVIDITSAVRGWISQVMTDQGVGQLNLTTMSPDHITTFTQAVVARSTNDPAAPAHLSYVPPATATANLEVAMAKAEVFRKNISSAPGLATDEVSLDTMDDIWVTPQRADGGDPSMCDSEGSCATPATVNPLLAFYLQPPDNKSLAKPFWGDDDAWVAVSLDNGATWKRTDLSQSADRTVTVGDDPYADVNRIKGVVEGNKALVTWVSTYCPSTDPMDLAPVAGDATAQPPVPALDLTATTPADLHDPAVYNTYDIFGVSGAQGEVDYGDPSNPAMMYRPEVGKVAYHCVWAARGVFDSATQAMTWYAPEQITSGVRDANLDMPAAAMSPDGSKGAFAVVWQEDPMGQNPGMGAGEGVGWGGAHTNKGTDIWYASIDMDCFSQTGAAAAANGCYPAQSGGAVSDGRPVPAYRLSAPVPVSDDNGCVLGASGWNAPYCQVLAKAFGTMVQTTKGAQSSGQTQTFARSGKENPMCAVKNIDLSPYWTDANWPTAMGTLETQCDSFDPTLNSVPLDGDTAASRPKVHLVYDEHTGGMRTLLVYEEQKAMGFLCKGNATCQADRLDFQGKFVLFNSFPAGNPVTVDPGGILDTLTTNYMDTNHDGVGDTVRVASDGTAFRYIFENARNGRLAVQDANNAAYSNGRIGADDL
ncbi:MAG: choice-of-anchor O protein, partial [Gammaproteobacteria bacterium]